MKQYKTIEDVPYKLISLRHKYLKGYKYAHEMLKHPTGPLPIIINAADEEAIRMYKNKKIKFLDIYKVIDKSINVFKDYKVDKLDDVYKLDALVRKQCK